MNDLTRWLALILSQRGRLPEYLQGNRGVVTSKEYRAIDSLYYHALSLNPFVYRRFDQLLFDTYIDIIRQRYESRTGERIEPGALRYEFDRDVMSTPSLRGWIAYAGGNWDEAIRAYTAALKGARYKAGLLASRARAAFLKSDYAAALVSYERAAAAAPVPQLSVSPLPRSCTRIRIWPTPSRTSGCVTRWSTWIDW